MNVGLTSQEVGLVLEFLVKANDDQVRAIRGVAEGEWKKRQLNQTLTRQVAK